MIIGIFFYKIYFVNNYEDSSLQNKTSQNIEFVDVRMIFMQAKMETKIISDMAKKGLVPSETPPQKIIITKKD